jgi:DNA-binding transcriptional MerR regulator
MLTIGQLARHSGVPARTVRFYHSIGLLAEPARDASGYRRYSAADAIALLKVRGLAEAGIPLAQIPALLIANGEDRSAAIERIDRDLEHRITRLQDTRRRLHTITDQAPLPPGVAPYLELLRQIGLSAPWVQMEHDLWMLAFATDPEAAQALLADQHQAKSLPEVQQVYRDYDRARDLDPDDPCLISLAERIAEIARDRYADAPAPAPPANSPVPALIQDMINSVSPAWRRLDRYLRDSPANPTHPRPRRA